ncbi:hypothetical protein MATL_G00261490 [Megalops atlanticus]|uniref:Sushi domain-containing protein n=1 Tax=Megalops atlanticus TaxID=7932 RepID=A0A9D3P900_MEGAT|nr:hypothetical protein MATL_G00261490 [Megalops atlanticus]
MMSGHATVMLFLLLPLTKNFPHGVMSAKGMDLSQDTATKESCPPPPLKDKTKPFERMQSYEENHKFYYTCMEGYVRKAGTSSLIRCKKDDKGKAMWDNIDAQTSLICIPDPKKTPEERGPEGRATSAVVEPKTTQMTTATTATWEESTPGTTPFTTANTLTPFRLTTTTTHTLSKLTTSRAKTFFNPSTLAVKPSSSATADDNDTIGANRQSRTISIGVSSTGVILLIALLLAGAAMLKRRCCRGATLLHVEQDEQVPMSSREGHQPRDVERYIPVAQYDQ